MISLACASESGQAGAPDDVLGDSDPSIPSDASSSGGAVESTGATGGTASGGGEPTTTETGGVSASGGSASSGGASSAGGSPGTGGAGTLSDGCPVTQEGFSTVSAMGLDGTTGGEGGEVVTVTTQSELEMYAGASEPYIIKIEGIIPISPGGHEVSVASNKTILGVGDDAGLSGGGFRIIEQENVIIRNLSLSDMGGSAGDPDGIQMDTSHHIWIDHCELSNGDDGLIDSRKDNTYLTVSWNVLRDHNKAFGIGWTDNVTAEMTIHHNMLHNTRTRNPSTDNVLRAHLYNNWLKDNGNYGNYSRGGTHMVLENSVFEGTNRPHFYDSGSLVAIGNLYIDTTGEQESSGSAYDAFNPSDFYQYELTPTDEVTDLLTRCAGPRAELGN